MEWWFGSITVQTFTSHPRTDVHAVFLCADFWFCMYTNTVFVRLYKGTPLHQVHSVYCTNRYTKNTDMNVWNRAPLSRRRVLSVLYCTLYGSSKQFSKTEPSRCSKHINMTLIVQLHPLPFYRTFMSPTTVSFVKIIHKNTTKSRNCGETNISMNNQPTPCFILGYLTTSITNA